MNRKLSIALFAAVVIIVGGVIGCSQWLNVVRAVEQAELRQEQVHGEYQALLAMAHDAGVTVSENGREVGFCTLEDLGLQAVAQDSVTARFSELDRLNPADFRALPNREKLDWDSAAHPEDVRFTLPMEHFDASVALSLLNAMPRQEAIDASMTYENGSYRIHAEKAGSILREDVIVDALRQQAAQIRLGDPDALQFQLEITDADCYVPPVITVENGGFDPAAALQDAISAMEIRVKFRDGEEVLTPEAIGQLVILDLSGAVSLNEDAVTALLDGWALTHHLVDAPYLFDSYVGGPVPIDFLLCDYTVRTDALRAGLRELILAQTSGVLEATYDCFDKKGEPFAIAGTYVEVDIKNQHMVFYKDGELIVATDVVTGRPRAWRTITGLFYSHDKRTKRWLVGADYCVFVDYWIRFKNAYGIHDAQWREEDEFGGETYLKDGSHGCVNTPTEAMATLYETIEDGTPVLVYDLNESSAS